jgi:hypothetical protein
MVDWKALLDSLGVPNWDAGKNVSPGHINIRCPFCDDHSNHGGFDIEKGHYSCWRCEGGHPVRALSLAAGIPQKTAEELIQRYTTGSSPTRSRVHASAKEITLPGGAMQEPHRKYLEGRGFDPDELAFYHGLLGTGISCMWEGIDFKYRIIIPVYDLDGRLCTFQGRDYTGRQEIRYKCCPVEKAVVHHKHLLYGAEMCRARDHIVVCEGVFDQWRLGPGSVATFGTSLTREQVSLLSMWPRVTMLFDPEEEAQERARKVARDLSACGCQVEVCAADFGLGKDGKLRDPGDLTRQEAQEVMREILG